MSELEQLPSGLYVPGGLVITPADEPQCDDRFQKNEAGIWVRKAQTPASLLGIIITEKQEAVKWNPMK